MLVCQVMFSIIYMTSLLIVLFKRCVLSICQETQALLLPKWQQFFPIINIQASKLPKVTCDEEIKKAWGEKDNRQ
ncbi:hypothetical protein NC651_018812 [Populus alba x Populus x berolinensis]|nr:hypothetical protein NC651_018812 [Populus alba x Populus x berolinensis]